MSAGWLGIKRILGKCWQSDRSPAGRRIILLYHAVGNGPWAIPTRVFRAQMAWLRERYDVVSLDGMLRGAASGSRLACITFDDGYASVHDAALPVLAEIGVTATVYVNSGWIGEARLASRATAGHYLDEEFLATADVQRLVAAGWTIGSHGVDHFDLTVCSPSEVRRQLRDSKRDIERRIGSQCQHFAYTWGRNTPGLRAAVADAGYRYAAGARHGPVREGVDPFVLPRINVEREYALSDFKDIVDGAWDYLAFVQRMKATTRAVMARLDPRAQNPLGHNLLDR